MTVTAKKVEVFFHPEQLRYLERIFPEVIFDASATEAALRNYHGQRSVLQFIRARTRDQHAL